MATAVAASQPLPLDAKVPLTTPVSTTSSSSSTRRPSLHRRATTTTPTGVVFRRPNLNPPGFTPPPLKWLGGVWHFTHSTLPIWKDKRNMRISYTVYEEPCPEHSSSSARAGKFSFWPASPASSDGAAKKLDRLDDVIEFQEPGSDKFRQFRGRDLTTPGSDTRAWDWRGKGIIKVASSHWEVLGWGVDDHGLRPLQAEEKLLYAPDANGDAKPKDRDYWMVTYFIKTVFTPPALDIYSTNPNGLSDEAFSAIRQALVTLKDPEIDRLLAEVYACKHD